MRCRILNFLFPLYNRCSCVISLLVPFHQTSPPLLHYALTWKSGEILQSEADVLTQHSGIEAELMGKAVVLFDFIASESKRRQINVHKGQTVHVFDVDNCGEWVS